MNIFKKYKITVYWWFKGIDIYLLPTIILEYNFSMPIFTIRFLRFWLEIKLYYKLPKWLILP